MNKLSQSASTNITEPFGSFWSNHELLTPAVMQEAAGWGYDYPASLKDAMRAYKNVDEEKKQRDQMPLSNHDFQVILTRAKEYAINSNSHLQLPYHYEKHFKEFAQSAIMLFDKIHGIKALHEMLPARQMIEIAGWLHDCHHTGCTLRWDYDETLYEHRSDYSSGVYKLFMEDTLGREISTEYVSAWAANDLLEGLGISVPQRLFVVKNIWATTFGGSQAQARGIQGTPAVTQPENIYHALMRVADIWYPKELADVLLENYRVCVLEYPADGRLSREDVTGFITSEIQYLHYRLSTMRRLDERVMAYNNTSSITIEGQTCALDHIARCEASLNENDPDTFVWDSVARLLRYGIDSAP